MSDFDSQSSFSEETAQPSEPIYDDPLYCESFDHYKSPKRSYGRTKTEDEFEMELKALNLVYRHDKILDENVGRNSVKDGQKDKKERVPKIKFKTGHEIIEFDRDDTDE